MKITLCGAAKIVSGSCYLVEVGTTKFLIDCGMLQGPKEITKMNYDPFKFNASEIDFVLLTHAHIDHSGLLPKLRLNGFRGQIYTTAATRDFVEILLQDSAKIQEENIEQENRSRQRTGQKPRQPLYSPLDAEKTMELFAPIEYRTFRQITENITVRYQDAGHILGSASIELFVTEGDKKTKIVFSGDIGQWNTPIVQDPTLIAEADYVFMESTYGDRLHEDVDNKEELLLKYVTDTYKRGGRLMIPSFAVERTQELLYFFNKMIISGKFPQERIFLDSPLAIKATELFKKHKECYDSEAIKEYTSPFTPQYLECLDSAQDSQRINKYDKPCIVIAGNGMCSAGRILHHLKHGLWDHKNTLLFVGYQAEWTLGRTILEGEKRVRVLGLDIVVKADIAKISSFSGHADANQLVKWASGFTTKPKKVFITHGEGSAQTTLQSNLAKIGLESYIPSMGEVIEL